MWQVRPRLRTHLSVPNMDPQSDRVHHVNTGAGIACEVSIVMPCLNEAETLERCIRKAQTWLTASNIAGEVIVADNGSNDGSPEIARRCGARVIEVRQRGYGVALYYGSRAANGRYIVMGDSDDSYDFSNLSPFMLQLRSGCDLVMGNRFAGGIEPGAMPWKNQHIGNPGLSTLGRLMFKCPARDFLCGLRGYTRQAFERMDLRTTGMEFGSEMIIKATLLGMRIAEVPTTLRPDGRSRPPHLKPWRDGWRNLRFMLLYSPRWLFFYPGLALASIGLLAGGWLATGPKRVGHATVDVHTMLYASVAVLLGYQSILFSVFTKVFAVNHGLLPRSRGVGRLLERVRLEAGLGIGAVLVAIGLTGSLFAFLNWRAGGFGPLSFESTLRRVIPYGLCMTVGAQTVFASFFLSVLKLGVRQFQESA